MNTAWTHLTFHFDFLKHIVELLLDGKNPNSTLWIIIIQVTNFSVIYQWSLESFVHKKNLEREIEKKSLKMSFLYDKVLGSA